MPESPRRAKIVCTLGPATQSESVIRKLVRAGMDVARLNFSHGTHDEHRRAFETVRRVAEEEGAPVGILQDLQGPKIRIGDIPQPRRLKRGDRITLAARRSPDRDAIRVSYPRLPRELERGDAILLDDGLLRLEVLATTETEIRCKVLEGGVLRSRKGVNVPGRTLGVPALTAKDRKDLELGLELGVDVVALSFVREPGDVRLLRRFLEQRRARVPVVAKIEKPQAIDNLDGILEAADAIMVARGDLGVELPPERVPVLQKRMILLARAAGKPVIIATQMLESMVTRTRPTRAEASDVANAVFDGTDAVMLSAETAVGEHPVLAVSMMDRIVTAAEGSSSYRPGPLPHMTEEGKRFIAEAIGEAAGKSARDLGARAIAVFTQSGWTAGVVSKFRPRVPVFAFTPSAEVCRRLSLVWGVRAELVETLPSTDAMAERVTEHLRRRRRVKRGDLIVITAGTPDRPGVALRAQ